MLKLFLQRELAPKEKKLSAIAVVSFDSWNCDLLFHSDAVLILSLFVSIGLWLILKCRSSARYGCDRLEERCSESWVVDVHSRTAVWCDYWGCPV